MTFKQISIFIENKQGTLVKVLSILKEAGIQIIASTVADTIDNGILDITHTFVDPSKRGQGIAKELVRRCDNFSKREGLIITASCSYAAEALGMKQENPSCRIGQ